MTASPQIKLNKLLNYLPAWYFLILGVASFIFSALGPYTFTWFDAIIMLILALPAIFRNKWVYAVFGVLSTFVWCYFLFAVTVSHTDYLSGEMSGHSYGPVDILVGYVITITSATFSVMLVYQGTVSMERKSA